MTAISASAATSMTRSISQCPWVQPERSSALQDLMARNLSRRLSLRFEMCSSCSVIRAVFGRRRVHGSYRHPSHTRSRVGAGVVRFYSLAELARRAREDHTRQERCEHGCHLDGPVEVSEHPHRTRPPRRQMRRSANAWTQRAIATEPDPPTTTPISLPEASLRRSLSRRHPDICGPVRASRC